MTGQCLRLILKLFRLGKLFNEHILPAVKKENIVVQELDNEVLIYDLKDNKVFCLNAASAIIWQLCDGTKTVSEISQTAEKKLNSKI